MPLPMYSEKPSHPLDSIKHIIAIAAGKGGVGKSTVAANVALTLSRFGYSVGLLDADVYGPSQRKLLPENQPPAQQGEIIIPAMSYGIKLVSMAYFGAKDQAASVRAPIANGIISQFLNQVDWGRLDFLLIDFPPGTGDIQLTLGQKAKISAALMVTTPQEVAMLDVRKAMQLFTQLNIPILGIVENMSYYWDEEKGKEIYLFGKGGGERLAREYGLPYLGGIPIDPVLSTFGDNGQSIYHTESQEVEAVRRAFLHLTQGAVDQLMLLNDSENGGLSHFELVWEESH